MHYLRKPENMSGFFSGFTINRKSLHACCLKVLQMSSMRATKCLYSGLINYSDMRKVLIALVILTFAFAVLAQPPPPPPPPPPSTGCLTSSLTWQWTPFTTQTGSFSVEFDATPAISSMDGAAGLSQSQASAYTSLAAIVRFNPSGNIDARNGPAYQAASIISYAAGVTYHFRMVVNISSHTYSAYVTPPGLTERAIGTNFAFRTEHAGATSLSYLNVYSGVGSHTTCGFILTTSTIPPPPPPPPPGGSAPVLTIISPAQNAVIQGT
ncbi:MAG: hypothetical protein AAB737_02825, partial [Patescibacteria group bacterium]